MRRDTLIKIDLRSFFISHEHQTTKNVWLINIQNLYTQQSPTKMYGINSKSPHYFKTIEKAKIERIGIIIYNLTWTNAQRKRK